MKPYHLQLVLLFLIHHSATLDNCLAQTNQSIEVNSDGKPVNLPKRQSACPFTSLEDSNDEADLNIITLKNNLIDAKEKMNQCILLAQQGKPTTNKVPGPGPTGPGPMSPNTPTGPSPDTDCLGWKERLQEEKQNAVASIMGAVGTEYESCHKNENAFYDCVEKRFNEKSSAMKKYCDDKKVQEATNYVTSINSEIQNAIQLITNNPACAATDNGIYYRAAANALKGISNAIPNPKAVLAGQSIDLIQHAIDLGKIIHNNNQIKKLKLHEDFKTTACNLFLASKGDPVFGKCGQSSWAPIHEPIEQVNEEEKTIGIGKQCVPQSNQPIPENTMATLYASRKALLVKQIQNGSDPNLGQKLEILNDVTEQSVNNYRKKLKAEKEARDRIKSTDARIYAQAMSNSLNMKLDMCMKTPRIWYKTNGDLNKMCNKLLSCFPDRPNEYSKTNDFCQMNSKKDQYQYAIIDSLTYIEPEPGKIEAIQKKIKENQAEIPDRRFFGLLPMTQKAQDKLIAKAEENAQKELARSTVNFVAQFEEKMKALHGNKKLSVGCNLKNITEALEDY